MKKYRILKLEYDNYFRYCIQKRFLLFWWISLDSVGNYVSSYWIPTYYDSLDEAKKAIRRFNPKKTVIDEV